MNGEGAALAGCGTIASMIVCPVCEHAQAHGSECDVCGKSFPRGIAREVPVERLPGLEVTRVDAGETTAGLPVRVAPVEGLEHTPLKGGPDLPVVPIPELERAADRSAASVPVPVMRLGELEVHREEPTPPTERTAMPTPGAPITCRYCRNVQAQGLVCDRCGMRLVRYMNDPSTSASGPVARRRADEGTVVLHKCGVRTRVGAPCTSCGVFVPDPDAA